MLSGVSHDLRTPLTRMRLGLSMLRLGTISEEDISVEWRPAAVRRALDNLVGNALRYGDMAEVSLHISDRFVRFTIADNGPGIPADRREEATRPFVRLDEARNQDAGSGVGLGLAIVADIARTHGGMLRLGESTSLGGLQAELVLAR